MKVQYAELNDARKIDNIYTRNKCIDSFDLFEEINNKKFVVGKDLFGKINACMRITKIHNDDILSTIYLEFKCIENCNSVFSFMINFIKREYVGYKVAITIPASDYYLKNELRKLGFHLEIKNFIVKGSSIEDYYLYYPNS